MRDMDNRALLSGDFLVVYGDIISNLPLESAIQAHRERRAKDKNAIMTMVLREAGTNHRTKAQDVSPVFVLDPTKNRCLHYEQMRPHQSSRFVNLDPDILKEHEEIEVRQDLIDCGIDICTPDVLALWSDNFDYEAPRKGFLHSVLKDYELNGKTIHTHIVDEHYAARVKNLRAYDAVTRDVLSRWAYPICPDSNLVKDQTYRLLKNNVYREEGVVLARSCVIGSRTVIGRATAVGEGSTVTNSIIGRRCIIGRNVHISGSYIWDDAVIGDGSVISNAIIANEASVGKRCKIESGALLSYGVYISDGMTIAPGSRITRMKRKPTSDTLERGTNDKTIVGSHGEGFSYAPSDEESDEDALGLTSLTLHHANTSSDSISTLNSTYSTSSYADNHAARSSRTESFGSIGSVASDDSQQNQRAAIDFHHDAAASIYDSLQKGDEAANIQLELTALRMTADASPHQVRRAVIAAFMKRISALIDTDGLTAAQAVKTTIPVHKVLLERTMFDRSEDVEEKIDQVDFLLLMQADLCHRVEGERILVLASNELVLGDVVSAEGFEQWWGDERSVASEELVKVRALMGGFMDALVGSSGSEEGSSEEEESEEEED